MYHERNICAQSGTRIQELKRNSLDSRDAKGAYTLFTCLAGTSGQNDKKTAKLEKASTHTMKIYCHVFEKQIHVTRKGNVRFHSLNVFLDGGKI